MFRILLTIIWPLGAIFNEYGVFCHLFGHWPLAIWPRFPNFYTPWGQFFKNLVYFKHIWLLETKWRQLQILVAIANALYPFILHFGGFWGIE